MTIALDSFTDGIPLEEIGGHIASNFPIARRSSIIIESSISKIGKNTGCVQYPALFRNEKAASIVRF